MIVSLFPVNAIWVNSYLLIRDEDVQVLHGFDSAENAQAYLQSDLFKQDVVAGLAPLLAAAPDVRVYTIA